MCKRECVYPLTLGEHISKPIGLSDVAEPKVKGILSHSSVVPALGNKALVKSRRSMEKMNVVESMQAKHCEERDKEVSLGPEIRQKLK